MNTNLNNALNHVSGQVPVDLGSAPTSGLHIKLIADLRKHYGLEKKMSRLIDPYQMLGAVEDDLREAIGVSTAPVWGSGSLIGVSDTGKWKEWEAPWGETILVPEQFVTKREGDRIYAYVEGDTSYPPTAVMALPSYFFDSIIYQQEIDEDHLNPEDNLQEFELIREQELDYLNAQVQRNCGKPYGLVGNFGGTGFGDIALVPGGMLKEKKGIRDITEWYVSVLTRPAYVHAVFERQCEIALQNLEKIYEKLGNSISVIYVCGTDFGTQNAPFCSVETFNTMYAPYYRQINRWIHQNTAWKTFKHTCGSIEPLIEPMIECGFDILNPVQWTARNMDMRMLKKRYGSEVVFWGGGVDTQNTMPFGSADAVRKEVLEACEVFSKDGGFVFNTIHNLLSNSPVANIVAMFEAVKEFNQGR